MNNGHVPPPARRGVRAGGWLSSVLAMAATITLLAVSAPPAGAYGTWAAESAPTDFPAGTPTLNAVSCPTDAVCYAVGNGGAILYSSNANGATPTWTSEPSGVTANLTGISCTSASVCYAVGASTAIRTSSGPGGWSATAPGLANAPWTGISCVGSGSSSDTCAAVASGPFGAVCALQPCPPTAIMMTTTGGTAWVAQAITAPANSPSASRVPLTSVSCVSARVCVAGGGIGNFVQYDGATWAVNPNYHSLSAPVLGLIDLSTVQCVLASLGVGSCPSANPLPGSDVGGVSCVTTTRCYAVLINNAGPANVWVNSSIGPNDTGPGTWVQTTGATNNNGYQHGISCVGGSGQSTDTCFSVGDGVAAGVQVMHTANGGASWDLQTSNVSGGANASLYGVSCRAAVCQVVGTSGAAAAIAHN